MRRIVPDTQAVLRGTINSNPSPDTRVTYSELSVFDCDTIVVKEGSKEDNNDSK